MSLKEETVDTDQATKIFFFDDVVFKVDKNGRIKFGMVVDAAEDYDSDIDSDEELDNSVRKGEVRVVWHPEGKDQVVKERNIRLAERTVNPGDIVRRSSGKNTQKGICRDVIRSADVQLKDTPYVIKNVSSDRLIYDVSDDLYVMLDGWIGTIIKIKQKLVLKTHSGAVVEVPYYDINDVKLRDPSLKNRNEHFVQATFYPGQTLVGSIDALKNANWLATKPKVKNAQKISFLVTHLEVVYICVDWEVRTEYSHSDGKENKPEKYVTGTDLNRVKFINAFNWNSELSELVLLEIEETDLVNLTTTSEWRMQRRSFYENLKLPRNNTPSEVEENVNIVQNTPFYSVFKFDSEDEDKEDDWQNNDDQTLNDDWKTEDGWQTEDDHETDVEKSDDEESDDRKPDDEKPTDKADVGGHQKADHEAVEEKADSDQITNVDKKSGIDRSANVEQQIKDDHETDGSSRKLSFTLNTVRKSILKRLPHPTKKGSSSKLIHPGFKKPKENIRIKIPTTGDRFVVEVVLVHTQLTVVWQDGTIESGIPSKEVYIDEDFSDKEDLFPGDFVIHESEKLNTECTNYGVVQKVDPNERTVIVKWFQTSTDIAQVERELVKETSIYDLIRHSDYNFDFKTQVSRVANFEGGDVTCVVGYVIGRNPDGLITVGWVDGHYSKCAPTDISPICSHKHFSRSDDSKIESLSFELSSLDHVNSNFNYQFNLAEKALNDFQMTSDKSQMLRAFTEVHVKCRFLDTLMNTSFFSEDKFFELDATARNRSNGINKNEQKDATSTTNLQDSQDSGHDSKNDSNDGLSSENLTETESLNLCTLYAILHSILKVKIKNAMQEISKRVGTFPSNDSHELLALNELQINDEVLNSTTIEERPDIISSPSSALSTSHTEGFAVLENSPTSHKFKSSEFTAIDLKKFHRAVKADHQILRTSLPSGVSVRAYEDRMDLLSVMIEGPTNTPYEDGIFLFDFQLSRNYPHAPPICHYISYCSDRLNPNLYEDGKVCVSLLGTWSGKETEMWGPGSTLLQIIVSIQGLILVAEPYYNEPGYVKEKGTPRGDENSQMYNELAVLKVMESMTNVMAKPSEVFREEIFKHFRERGDLIVGRMKSWIDQSNENKPEFPLMPTTRGFRIKLEFLLVNFCKQLEAIGQ